MEPEAIPLPADFAEKTARNARVSARYDELRAEGKHGHYETMYRVVHEEVARERERCARVCEEVNATTGECPEMAVYCAAAIRSGTAPAQEPAGGMWTQNVFRGPPPEGYADWYAYMVAPVKQGAFLRAATLDDWGEPAKEDK